MRGRRAGAVAVLVAAVAAAAILLPNASGGTVPRAAHRGWSGKGINATPKIRRSKEIGRSKPLRTIARQYLARHPNMEGEVPATVAARAPEGPAASISSPTVFEGIANSTFIAPPDPTGEVSPTQYVESVNNDNGALMAVFDKTGQVLSGPFRMEKLWNKGDQCRKNGQGDPIVQYDQLAGRWVLTQFAFTVGDFLHGPFYECIAVSDTGDATGLYSAYSFKISKNMLPDFPKFGVWPDGYYMSIHLFGNNGNGSYKAQGVIAFDREKMLLGEPARGMIFFVNKGLFGLLPADAQGLVPPPDGAPNYMAVMRDDNVGDSKDRVLLYGFFAKWNHPAKSRIDGPTDMGRSAAGPKPDSFNSNLCVNSFYCIPQKGSKYVQLDAITAMAGKGPYQMYPLAYRNFGDHESLVLNHTVRVKGTDRAAINWFELRAPGEDAFINQQGTYAPDKLNRWVASLGMDKQNNIAMGFALSAKSIFPSIAYTGRLAGDPLGTMTQGEQLMVAGAGAQKGLSRWGDYTAISIDPVDDCTFWYVNEFYPKSSGTHWHTAIGHFSFSECTGAAPTSSPTATP
jgi:hypothetical protein